MPFDNPPDLIARAQQGSGEAAGKLYEEHFRSVFRYLFYATGDQAAAEDLTGDVFLKMVQALPGYRATSAAFRTWLFQIARNLAIDHYRRSSAHPVEQLAESAPDQRERPEAHVEANLTAERLQAALQRIGSDQRDVLVMRFIDDLSLQETARVLHRSEDAVKGLQRRGLAALRDLLTTTEENDGQSPRPV